MRYIVKEKMKEVIGIDVVNTDSEGVVEILADDLYLKIKPESYSDFFTRDDSK